MIKQRIKCLSRVSKRCEGTFMHYTRVKSSIPKTDCPECSYHKSREATNRRNERYKALELR